MTQIIKTGNGTLTDEQVKTLACAAKSCKIVAFPTDTVYCLGSTGLIKAASRRIFQIKERSSIKPLPVFVHSAEAAKKWAEWTPLAEGLAKRFWPGPLTLVLKHTAEGQLLTFPEYKTIAVSVPNHAALLKVLEASGVPWAQSSANRSGQPPLADGAAVTSAFSGAVDFIVDGGRAPGVESTIVDASGPAPRVIREGAIKAADITGVTA